ncbi:MAG: hypothetical protein C4322_09805, partial [Mastigocladus sp. ERB_26_1]
RQSLFVGNQQDRAGSLTPHTPPTAPNPHLPNVSSGNNAIALVRPKIRKHQAKVVPTFEFRSACVPKSAKHLLIGSTEAYSGKSATVLGLSHLLQQKGLD